MSAIPPLTHNGRTGPFFPSDPEETALNNLAAMTPELMKRLYLHPDYRDVIAQNATALLRQLERDPELLEAFKHLFERYGISLDDSSERLEPVSTTVAVSFLVGAGVGLVIGWLSEEKPKK